MYRITCDPSLHSPTSTPTPTPLRNQRRGRSGIILKCGCNLLLGLIITSKTMNAGLDKDKPELGIAILSVRLEVLADGNRLFDEVPKVLRDGWAKSYPQTKR
jgi:hypothetical protein